LEKDDPEDGKERIVIFSDQCPHFRVLLQDLFCAEAVWLLLFGINEVSSLYHR